jgi:hypothetical protein
MRSGMSGRGAMRRAGYAGLKRNVAVALGNLGGRRRRRCWLRRCRTQSHSCGGTRRGRWGERVPRKGRLPSSLSQLPKRYRRVCAWRRMRKCGTNSRWRSVPLAIVPTQYGAKEGVSGIRRRQRGGTRRGRKARLHLLCRRAAECVTPVARERSGVAARTAGSAGQGSRMSEGRRGR